MAAIFISGRTEEEKQKRQKTNISEISMKVVDKILKCKSLDELLLKDILMNKIVSDPYYLMVVADHFGYEKLVIEVDGVKYKTMAPPKHVGGAINLLYGLKGFKPFDLVLVDIDPIWGVEENGVNSDTS